MNSPASRLILFISLVLVWWIAASFFTGGRVPKLPNPGPGRSFDPFSFFCLFLVVNACALGLVFCAAFVLILAAILPGVTLYVKTRIAAARINRRCWAPSSIDVPLSTAKLEKLRSDLYETGGGLVGWLDRRVGSRATMIFCIDDHLRHGDSRSAVVVSLEPLMVAAYAEELDCIAMLRFPDFLIRDYDLHLRDRLLSVNRYSFGGPIAADLERGALSSNRFSNVFPLIADFLTDDVERLRWRKQRIGEDEWRRTWTLAQRYREKHGDAARDGRPVFSFAPATVEIRAEGEVDGRE